MPFIGGATADPHSHLYKAREIAENRLLLSAVSRSAYIRDEVVPHITRRALRLLRAGAQYADSLAPLSRSPS